MFCYDEYTLNTDDVSTNGLVGIVTFNAGVTIDDRWEGGYEARIISKGAVRLTCWFSRLQTDSLGGRSRFSANATVSQPSSFSMRCGCITMSFRDVENLFAEHGLDISNVTVQWWGLKFEATYARRVRRHRPRPDRRWHLDEIFSSMQEKMYLWRSIDSEGEIVDVLVQARRGSNRFGRSLVVSRLADDSALLSLVVTIAVPVPPKPASCRSSVLGQRPLKPFSTAASALPVPRPRAALPLSAPIWSYQNEGASYRSWHEPDSREEVGVFRSA